MHKETRPKRPLRTELTPLFKRGVEWLQRIVESDDSAARRPDLAEMLLSDAVQARVSDIHLEPTQGGARVRFRIDGAMWDAQELAPEEYKVVVNQFKAMANLDPIVRFTPRDAHAFCSLAAGKIDMRIAIAPAMGGELMTVRLLDHQRLERNVRDLGLSEANLALLNEWLEETNGMFLSSGPTGSGKTTTLYALLHELKHHDRCVITLEDPVEYHISGVSQIQVDQLHQLSFGEGIKAILRHDPDLLMMGEIRDRATAHAGVDAALSGRVMLSTVHSRDAVGVVTALRNWGLADHEIAESLSVVVSQRLVRRICGNCKHESAPTKDELNWTRRRRLPEPQRVWRAKGCEKCHSLGYYGRIGVFEFWRLDAEDYHALLSHTAEYRMRQMLEAKGHATILKDAYDKAMAGVTTLAEARAIGVGPSGYEPEG